MIAERSSGVTVDGNMQGQSYTAGIDDENMGHIIGLFTDLYSDQQGAVVREYSTNGRDAQIEVGYTGPIEVTLPSPLSPFFKVKDYGCGLDAEDIRKIYSRYGTSTKRATNDQNGMLGLGCKSALTYTQQFTVESVKDGMRTVCSISREDDGVPVFTVVASVPDDGPNGTEVIVPVQRQHHADFETKARKFYSFWEPGTVLLNGEQPAPIEGLRIAPDLLLVKVEGYATVHNRVVMGGVAYPIESSELATGLPNNYRIVAFVPIGSVSFTPSRESLMYTRTTRDTLGALQPRIRAAVKDAVQKEIDKAKTPREALLTALEWRDLVGPHTTMASFAFKGKPLPENVQGDFTLTSRNSRKMGQSEHRRDLHVSYAANSLVVVGYSLANFTATHKRKLLQWCEDNKVDAPQHFLLTPVAPDAAWFDKDQIIQWSDVNAVKLPTNSPVWRNGRPTGAYDVHIGGNFQHIQAEDIDQEEPIYYCEGLNRWESQRYAMMLGKHFPAATVVCLPLNRCAKFKRNFPEAKTYAQGLQAAYDAWAAALTPGERKGLVVHDNGSSWLTRLDATRIDDPALRAAIHVRRNVKLDKVLIARREFQNVMHALDTSEKWTCPTKNYPLLDALQTWNLAAAIRNDLYVYLNAAYAAR